MRRMRNIYWIFIVAVVLISGCNNDDDPVNQVEQDLIGIWTSESFSLELTVDGKPIAQWYEDELGLSESEVQDILTLILEGFSTGLSGTFEFQADHTFISNFTGSPKETGTWQLSNNNSTLIITESDSGESTEMDIVSLSATTLIVGFEETDSDDLNGDGTDEDLLLKFELTFVK